MNPSLHIEPEDYLPAWEKASLHREIREYQLPRAEVIVCPQALVSASRFVSSEKALGGIYNSAGQHLDCSRHLRRGKDFTRDNPPRISTAEHFQPLPGRYLYLGWFFNHYGHFMLESLSRCWPLMNPQQFDGYLYHFHARSPEPVARLFEFLDLLDIPREKIHFITQNLRVGELHIPTQQAVLSRAISPGMLYLYQHLGKTAWERQGRPTDQPKVYVSRRLLPPDMRHACNEYHLERHFRQQGYRIFHPQLHPPQQQLALFYQTTHLAGLEGSGLHHVLFAREPQETWLLATPQRRADAITQRQLDDYRDSRTCILFQKGCPSPLIQPERTSFLVTSGSPAKLGIPEKADPWSRAIWLQGLARQMASRQGELDHFARQISLSDKEKQLLTFLIDPQKTLDDSLLECPLGRATAALVHQAQGNLTAARECLEASLDDFRDNPDFLARYAGILYRLKETPLAEKILNQALSLDMDNPDLLHLQGELLAANGHSDEAKTRFQDILSRYPLYRPALVSLAAILADQSNFPGATACLSRAMDIFPGKGNLHIRLTWYLMQTEDWSRAAKAAGQALELMPENLHSHSHLARIHTALGNTDTAMQHINEAIRRQPRNPGHYRLRARLHREMGNAAAAVMDEQRAKESRNPPSN
ncbi:glycosyltransferase family 61 protein [Thiolapillus brandeum]|uniref:Glycosyltransferase 61 catalytic domain-containing protein n=1 Tax=Thiolapillus brandeum TaxID=1076588 RepID=A0A7U6GGA6_9GAMM|nr:glycosyltransferase family 61 protein [Thiolapillus brandeum]BAO43095.1 hypothetical protein TBH_C0147 [Thiolapillus brandeum]